MRRGIDRAAIVAAGVIALVAAACQGESKMSGANNGAMYESTSAIELGKISKERIFFGHQSVGYNILDGLSAAARDKGVSLSIIEGRSPGAASGPCVLHAAIGANEDPLGKMRDFDAIVRGGVGGWADIALMKLCYVDLRSDTDVAALFAAYKETMAGLARDYPRVAFLHSTVPLTTIESGPKARIKALLGRKLWGQADNAARERYNDLLRAEYGPSGRLFDLALAESTASGGPRAARLPGGDGRALLQKYTTDGGHLNELGSRRAAEALLATLAAATGMRASAR
jgi:hypothetical protein